MISTRFLSEFENGVVTTDADNGGDHKHFRFFGVFFRQYQYTHIVHKALQNTFSYQHYQQ